MANNQRVGGTIQFQIDGAIYSAKGVFTYNIGRSKKDAVIGADAVHGFKEMPQVPFIEGAITDNPDLDLAALASAVDVTAYLSLANGKGCILKNAWNASESTVSTEEGEIPIRFEAKTGEEVSAS